MPRTSEANRTIDLQAELVARGELGRRVLSNWTLNRQETREAARPCPAVLCNLERGKYGIDQSDQTRPEHLGVQLKRRTGE